MKKYKKQFFQQHKEKISDYHKKDIKNRKKTDVNFRLIVYTTNRVYGFLIVLIEQPSSKTVRDIDNDVFRKWIEFEFTPEMNWLNTEIDHVKPICSFDISNIEGLTKLSERKIINHFKK